MPEDKKNRGLYPKYEVTRLDGRGTYPKDKHFNCRYFVLDLTHDPYALPAIRAYAKECRVEYPVLAADLENFIKNKVIELKTSNDEDD